MIDFNEKGAMTLEEARAYVAVSRRTIYLMAEEGRLPGAFRLGKCWRVDKKILSDHVQKGVELPCELQGVANCEPVAIETAVPVQGSKGGN